jgi:hypothetical protein
MLWDRQGYWPGSIFAWFALYSYIIALTDNPVDGSVAIFIFDVVAYCKRLLDDEYRHKKMTPKPVMKEWKKAKRKRRSQAQIEVDKQKLRDARFDVAESEEEEEEKAKMDDVEEECVSSQSDELSLRFAFSYILIIRLMQCDCY